MCSDDNFSLSICPVTTCIFYWSLMSQTKLLQATYVFLEHSSMSFNTTFYYIFSSFRKKATFTFWSKSTWICMAGKPKFNELYEELVEIAVNLSIHKETNTLLPASQNIKFIISCIFHSLNCKRLHSYQQKALVYESAFPKPRDGLVNTECIG